MSVTYTVAVDWDKDGDYSDTGEDITGDVLPDEGITWERGRDAIRDFSPPAAGKAALTLNNASKDYSPDNTGSPLYGKLTPKRTITIGATKDDTDYALFAGRLDDIPQNPGKKQAGLTALGMLARLRGVKVSTGLYEGITTDAAIGHVLDAAGWPAGARTLDSGKTTLKYWWADADDAFDAVVQLLNTEGPGAAIYEDGNGYFVFESRHYRLTQTRATTSQATFHDSGATPPYHIAPFSYNPGLTDSIVNECTIDVNVRTEEDLDVIWELGQSLTIPAGSSTRIVVSAADGDPIKSAVTPVSGTDYTVTSGSVASLTLSRTSGPSTSIYIEAGSSGATISGLQLRAVRISKTKIQIANTIDASASQDDFELQTFNLPIWPELDINVAQDFTNAIVGRYKDPRATVTITVAGDDATHIQQVLEREISDRITVIEAQSGLSGDMHIEHVAHTLTDRHVVVLSCEKADDAGQYAVWGTARWGQSVWAF